MKQQFGKGVSLLEALVCLVLVAVLAGLAIPSLSQWSLRYEHKTKFESMFTMLSFARSKAISTGHTVTLCSGTNCSAGQNWEGEIIAFQDFGQTGRFEEELDTIFKTLDQEPEARWLWNNFRNKSFLSFKPNGTTFSLNGTLTLCVSDATIYSIKMNTSGRARSVKQPFPGKCLEETVSTSIQATHPQ